MRLRDALRIGPESAVAFVGAGGKSSALGCLARELSLDGRVVITTSTKFHFKQSSLAHAHLVLQEPSGLNRVLPMLEEQPSLLVTAPLSAEEKKWSGVDAPTLDTLHKITSEEKIPLLIEADGARRRSIKAPADHEPSIPPFVNLVVPTVGLDIVGSPLDDVLVHRTELVAALLGLAEGDPIEPHHVAALVGDVDGGLKRIPARAEVRVMLNKAEPEDRRIAGRMIADLLLQIASIQAVLLTAVDTDPPVYEVLGRVAGVVLAAGDSKRLGEPKQLIQWRGRSLVAHAVHAALEGDLTPIIVVLGADRDQVRQDLSQTPVAFVENPHWADGLSTSVVVGVDAANEGSEAIILLLADTPFVNAELVRALVNEYRHTLSPLVAPRAKGRRANPVLFDRVTFPALKEVTGNEGGRSLFKMFAKRLIEWDEKILIDVDTAEDLHRLRELE
jgi:molybdenum cofactor cytidylyltransferase